jgi:hypothetical protein
VAARGQLIPDKEGQRRAGRAGLVAIIEMPGGRIVEIDRALDHSEAKQAPVEGNMTLRLARDGGDVVNARRFVRALAVRCHVPLHTRPLSPTELRTSRKMRKLLSMSPAHGTH